MEEQLILFPTAKIAKEKGFDYKSPYFYMSYNKENPEYFLKHQYDVGCVLGNLEPVDNKFFELLSTENISGAYSVYTHAISAPTQSLLHTWFRNTHGIYITLDYGDLSEKWCFTIFRMKDMYILFNGDMKYKSYEDALETALFQALKLI